MGGLFHSGFASVAPDSQFLSIGSRFPMTSDYARIVTRSVIYIFFYVTGIAILS